MFCTKNNTIPSAFNKKCKTIDHIYPATHSQNNFAKSLIKQKQIKNALYTCGQVSGITYFKEIVFLVTFPKLTVPNSY